MIKKMEHLQTRGLKRAQMTAAAITLMEEVGAEKFSVRKLAERLGCDPMAVLYHFKSKDGLQRAMADGLTEKLEVVHEGQHWTIRLQCLALHYRQLALTFPMTFVLLQRYLNTGRSDYQHIEMVHASLVEAGVRDSDIPAVCLSWYASVIGLCMGEISGLIRPTTPQDDQELNALPAGDFPVTRRLQPTYGKIDPRDVFQCAIDMLARGIALDSNVRFK